MEMNKMELNKMNMVQLRALAKENKLTCYSRLRKAELIKLIYESSHKDETPKDERLDKRLNEKIVPITTQERPKDVLSFDQPPAETLSKRQLKRGAQKASEISKQSKSLRIEINDLKSQRIA